MSAPINGLALPHVIERIVEYIHFTSQHRVDGKRPQFHQCPEDPCATWHRWRVDSGWLG